MILNLNQDITIEEFDGGFYIKSPIDFTLQPNEVKYISTNIFVKDSSITINPFFGLSVKIEKNDNYEEIKLYFRNVNNYQIKIEKNSIIAIIYYE